MTRPLHLLDLFAGIGGMSLGLSRAGFQTAAFCEIEPWCQGVLGRWWPGVPIYDDIRELTAERLRADGVAAPDIISAGFPCQDVSLAGKGAGIGGARSGLFFEVVRLVAEIRPRWVLLENVAALRSRGLDRVLGEFAALGYDGCVDAIPACALGAPHRRDRIWIALAGAPQPAPADAERLELRQQPRRRGGTDGAGAALAGEHGAAWPVADAERAGRDRESGRFHHERREPGHLAPDAGGGGQIAPEGPPPKITSEEFKGKGRKAAMLPTPSARDWRSGKASDATFNANSRPLNEVIARGAPSGRLSPMFCEWLMGYPTGWTGYLRRHVESFAAFAGLLAASASGR